jgi:hypothetical protein
MIVASTLTTIEHIIPYFIVAAVVAFIVMRLAVRFFGQPPGRKKRP